MPSYFIDTNFYLRLLLNDIPAQAKTVSKYFDNARSGELEIIFLTEVLIEVAHVLRTRYKTDRKQIAQIFLDLVNTPYITLPDRDIILDVAVLYAKTNIDLVDLILIVRAENEGKQILTFDKGIISS